MNSAAVSPKYQDEVEELRKRIKKSDKNYSKDTRVDSKKQLCADELNRVILLNT